VLYPYNKAYATNRVQKLDRPRIINLPADASNVHVNHVVHRSVAQGCRTATAQNPSAMWRTRWSCGNPAHPKTVQTFEGVTSIVRDDARGLIYVANGDGIWILSHREVLHIYLLRHGRSPMDFGVFRGEPADLRGIRGIIHHTLALRGRGIIQLGLLLLIATPVARVAFSIFGFAEERDRMYVVFTLIVFSILLYSLIGSA
jgi:hypothetical protein